jgi:hypothetical protein
MLRRRTGRLFVACGVRSLSAGGVAAPATRLPFALRVAAAAAFVLATIATPAAAHLGNISYADFRISGKEVLLKFKYAAHVTPGVPADPAWMKIRQQVLALQAPIESWLRDNSSLSAGGKPCTLTVDNLVGPDANEDLEVHAYWTCDAPEVRGFRLDFHPLETVIDDWQTICSVTFAGETSSTVLSPGTTRWAVGEAGAPVAAEGHGAVEAEDEGGTGFSRFFALGVEHIWTGYDHLLFLLAVLLAGGGIWRLAGIVTSFTIAHSVTLGAAATGLVQLPIEPVEAVIALSIVYVAAENLLGRGADRRALVTFAFGLIHGFGFASVLAETALPAGGIVVPLLAFNLGVEAGQLAVVVVVVPLLSMLLRGSHAQQIRNALSVLIALAGAAWAIERITAMI